MIRLNLVCLICFWSAEIYNRNGGCWNQSSGVCGTKGYPVCCFQLGHVCVLLQLSIAAWLPLAVGAPLGEQEHTGKLFLVGDSSQSFISWLPLWHNISPSPFKQHIREMRDYYSVRIRNSIQPSWHDTVIMLCPYLDQTLQEWPKQGELFCFVQCLIICIARRWLLWTSEVL